MTFFIGSLFFTSAGFLQYRESVDAGAGGPRRGWKRVLAYRPEQIDWWATAIQLAGTLFFNVSTGNALRMDLSSQAAHQHIWRPDAFGSVCFLVASGLAWFEVCHGWLAWSPRSLAWWITLANLVGSVAFGVSAVASYIVPSTGAVRNIELSNLGTFVGALCFLGGAVLLLPERTEPAPGGLTPLQPRSALRQPCERRRAPEVVVEHGAGRVDTAHPVHPSTRGGGCRAQVDVLQRGPVRVPPDRRSEHGLHQGRRPPGDVPAHVVGVLALLVDGGEDRAGHDQVREAGGEPFDLGLHGRRHVDVRAGGDVAVAPQRLSAGRGPGGVGHPGLDDDAVRTVGVPARR